MKRSSFYVTVLLILACVFPGFAFQDPLDPIKEASRRREKHFAEQNYKDLQGAAAELAALIKDLNAEISKSDEHVISARIFDKLDRIERLTRKIRDKARGPY